MGEIIMLKISMRSKFLALVTYPLSCRPHFLQPREKIGSHSLKHYQLNGRVTAIDKPNKSLTVDGDEIPGFMAAMQMPYDVKDASLLDKLSVGDRITADVVVHDDDSWLEQIKVTQAAATPAPSK